jgi:hypothetical protein
MDIESAIKNKIKNNSDERLSIENLVCIALDNFTTTEIADFYQKQFDLDLRSFLEKRISDMYISRGEHEKLNTH